MYTTLDFLVQLNVRRFIVGASPELKCRTTNEADTAHVVASYRQLASRDISFLPTSFKSRVTAFEPTELLAERVQNISIYTVYIDMFCTRSAKSAVGSKAVTLNRHNSCVQYERATLPILNHMPQTFQLLSVYRPVLSKGASKAKIVWLLSMLL